jgi:DNA-3-methyladenine glycosylase I
VPTPPDDSRAAPTDGLVRCPWASDALLAAYHDEEWGVPVHDDRRHFEMLTLEGAQAGLSWRTVLARRDGYRQAFASFEPAGVASFTPSLLEALLADPGVIRHRGKLESVVTNARAFVAVQEAEGGFDAYVWRFVDGRPVRNAFTTTAELPASTPLSAALSRDLRRRGFSFVGPTICYAYLQATGLVNDHLTSCHRWRALG